MSRNSYLGPRKAGKLGLWKFWETWPNSKVGSKRERWGWLWKLGYFAAFIQAIGATLASGSLRNYLHCVRHWMLSCLLFCVIKHLFRSCFFDILTCEQRKKAPGGFSYIGSVYYPVIVGMSQNPWIFQPHFAIGPIASRRHLRHPRRSAVRVGGHLGIWGVAVCAKMPAAGMVPFGDPINKPWRFGPLWFFKRNQFSFGKWKTKFGWLLKKNLRLWIQPSTEVLGISGKDGLGLGLD